MAMKVRCLIEKSGRKHLLYEEVVDASIGS